MTVKEIAKICGVSPSTVSNAINGRPNISEETRKRILECVREKGYQPDCFVSDGSKQNSKIIGIIAEDLGQFSTTPILEAVMGCCEEYGYKSVVMNMRMYDKWSDTWYYDDQKIQRIISPMLSEMESIHAMGMIYIAGHGRIIHCIPKDFRTPTVIAYGWSENNRFPAIVPDDRKGGYDMMKHLLGHGHRQIGIIAGTPDNMHSQERLYGCQKALFEERIPYNPEWTYYGDWERKSGYQGAKELFRKGIKAMLCMNDQMAGGVYDFAQENHLVVGKDISVVGYDNRLVSDYLTPSLTTCELPLREIGYRAANTLINGMIGKERQESHEPVKLPCKFICRDSVQRL